MKKYLWLLLLPLGWIASQCTTPDDDPNNSSTTVDCAANPDACDIVLANNKLGFKMFKKLHEAEPDKNLFTSPMSISTALTMALNGAAGQTETEMQQLLGYTGMTLPEINSAYKYLLTTLPEMDNSVQLELANSIWHEKTFSVKPPFLAVNAENLLSEVHALDFRDPASVGIINGWVNDKTHTKIPTILDQISSDAVMYLINAIYFKGAWRRQFDESKTSDRDFYLADNSTTSVKMMSYGGETTLNYLDNQYVQAVDLPYGDSVFSMTLFLPKPGVSLSAVVDQLDNGAWSNWTSQLTPQEVILNMPRFKMEYEKVLNNLLIDMGMGSAFDPARADFSNISDINIFISLVKHKSFVEVNEEGTEAAAVTIIGFETTSIPSTPYVDFSRPFLFVIRENKSNGVLFVGKVMNPNE